MKCKLIFLLLTCLYLARVDAQINFNRVDTTMKIAGAGYKVSCRNKSINDNQLQIHPIGFDTEVHDLNFPFKGRVSGCMVDDLNADGWPDLVLFIYTDSAAQHGTVYALISDGNKLAMPLCILPDAVTNIKINKGYKGGDQFSMLEGKLLQKFPIYKDGDEKNKPTGGHRMVMYNLGKNEGHYTFIQERSFDTQ